MTAVRASVGAMTVLFGSVVPLSRDLVGGHAVRVSDMRRKRPYLRG